MPLPTDRIGWLKSAALWGAVGVWAIATGYLAGRALLDAPLLLLVIWLGLLLYSPIGFFPGQARGRGPRDSLIALRGLLFLSIGVFCLWFFGFFVKPQSGHQGWNFVPSQVPVASLRDVVSPSIRAILPTPGRTLGPDDVLSIWASACYAAVTAYGLLLLWLALRSPTPGASRKRQRAILEVSTQTVLGVAGDASERDAQKALTDRGRRGPFRRRRSADDEEF